MTELKPCPFCGGIGEILTFRKKEKGKYKYLSYVRCRHCFCKTDIKENKERAIYAWNRRTEK